MKLTTRKSIYILEDNAGGLTLQTNKYCHHYDGRNVQLALDYFALIFEAEDECMWDGNEKDHRFDPANVHHESQAWSVQAVIKHLQKEHRYTRGRVMGEFLDELEELVDIEIGLYEFRKIKV